MFHFINYFSHQTHRQIFIFLHVWKLIKNGNCHNRVRSLYGGTFCFSYSHRSVWTALYQLWAPSLGNMSPFFLTDLFIFSHIMWWAVMDSALQVRPQMFYRWRSGSDETAPGPSPSCAVVPVWFCGGVFRVVVVLGGEPPATSLWDCCHMHGLANLCHEGHHWPVGSVPDQSDQVQWSSLEERPVPGPVVLYAFHLLTILWTVCRALVKASGIKLWITTSYFRVFLEARFQPWWILLITTFYKWSQQETTYVIQK